MSSIGVRRASLLLAAALAGCVLPPREIWVRTTSQNFELIGAMPKDEAETFVRTLERFRAALLAIVFDGRLRHPDRILVVVAENLSRYSRTLYLGGTAVGASLPALGLSEVLILDGSISTRPEMAIIAKHELTHAITLPYAPGMPHWYAEALAGIFETVDIDHTRGVVTVGIWDRRHQKYRYSPLSVDAVFDWQAPVWDERSRMQYASAIQFMQMLQVRYPKRLSAFEGAMHDGTEWVQAWEQAFGDRDTPQLSLELQVFTLKEPKRPAARTSIRFTKTEVGPARAASAAETHAARALLYAFAQGRRSDTQAAALSAKEIEASLSDDDGGAFGLVASALLHDADPDTWPADAEFGRIKRVLANNPSNWRAAVLLAQTNAPLQERAQALERAWVVYRQPHILATLARTKLEQGDAPGALAAAKTAASAAPEAPYVTGIYLDALAANKICDREAATAAGQAADSLVSRKRVADYVRDFCEQGH